MKLPSSARVLKLVFQIREVIAAQGIRIYQPPVESDDESSADHARILTDAIPFSIIGSTEDVQTPDGRIVNGREYLWGVAEGKYLSNCFIRSSLIVYSFHLQSRTRPIAISRSYARCSSARTCWILLLHLRTCTMRTTVNSKWRRVNSASPRSRSWTTPSSRRKRNSSESGSRSRSRQRSRGSDNGSNT
jgi:hypothetical protein